MQSWNETSTLSIRYFLPCSLKEYRARSPSIHDVDYQPVNTLVEARESPEKGRCDVVINVVRILTARQIERIHTEANFSLRRVLHERQVQRKFAINPRVEREIS